MTHIVFNPACNVKEKSSEVIKQSKEPEKASNDNDEKEASDLNENSQKKLSCHICKYKCKNNNLVKKHFNSKHKDHLKCTLCDNKFSSAAAAAAADCSLQAHRTSIHVL